MAVATASGNAPNLFAHDGANGWPGQSAWIRAALTHFVTTILCGRDVGKTLVDPLLFLEEGRQARGAYDYGYVAQGHPQAEKFFEYMLTGFRPWVLRSKNKGQDRWIEFRAFGTNTGARMHFWSGEEGALENIRGVRLNRGSVDEAGFVHKSVLTTVGPMIASRNGKLIFKGTAKRGGCGFVWFKQQFEMGTSGEPGFISFNAPSECSPYNRVDQLLRLRKQLRDPRRPDEKTPEEIEEYDGAFISDIGACFRNLDATIVLPVKETRTDGLVIGADPVPGEQYVIGQDWGKKHDHSFSSVFSRRSQDQVAFRREPIGAPYEEQMRRLDELHRRYNTAIIVADARDAGGYINERLKVQYGDHMKEIAFTGQGPDGKGFHVARLKHLFDAGSWRLIKHPIQVEEFSLFQQTPIGDHSSGFYYEAPAGKHDDAVTASIFASSMLQTVLQPPAPKPKLPEFLSKEWYEWKARQRRFGVRRGGF